MTSLLPCPFCGKDAEVHESLGTLYVAGCDDEGCPGCWLGAPQGGCVEVAMSLWNKRADRTCIVTRDFNCSNCGKQIGVVRNCEMYETCDGRQAWKSLDHEVCDVPNYCPNCGARVKEES